MRASYPPPPAALGPSPPTATAGPRLEARWWSLAACFAVSVAAAGALLSRVWSAPYALRWTLGASIIAAGILAFVWRHRDENRRTAHEPRLEELGPGNVVTLTRGLILAMAGGFLFVPAPTGPLLWIPATLYTTAIVADLFDGVLARRANRATILGARLDIELDGFGVLLAFLLAVHLGQLPAWFLPVGLARPLFTFGLWWRQRNQRPTYELPPSRHRKLLAGIQMGFLSAALWPVLKEDALTVLGACLLAPTVVGFARDWLVVSGRVATVDAPYRRLERWTAHAMTRSLPHTIRLLALTAVVWLTLSGTLPTSPILKVTVMVSLVSLSVGFLGRLGAIALIIAVGIDAAASSLDPASVATLAGAAAILLFGTGPGSVWKPEEPYVLADVGGGG